MNYFYATIFTFVLIFIGLVVLGIRTIGLNKYFAMLILIFGLIIGLGFWFNPDIYHWYAFIHQQQSINEAKEILKQPKKVTELMQILERRVHEEPNDAKAWFLLGRLKSSEGNWVEAHDALFQAYRLEPKNIKIAIFYVETIWQTQGEITPYAKKILKEILKQDTNQADALLMLASDAKDKKCYQQAIQYWRQILVLLPKDSQMYQALMDAIQEAQNKHQNKNCPI